MVDDQEHQEQLYRRMQEQKAKMKETMIMICSYLEQKYVNEINAVLAEPDDRLHYDV